MNVFELSGLLRNTDRGKFQRNSNLIMRILIHSVENFQHFSPPERKSILI